jgi:glutamate-1-semialdehyde 2,1-aminomutase
MGLVPPVAGYLEGLRTITKKYGTLLIFDEVITGFRCAFGGAAQLYYTQPDITCLGKIVGGGLPAGVFGASTEIMSSLSPLGPVYQAGTLSGNPLAMAAGLTAIKLLSKPGTYEHLEAQGKKLAAGLFEAAKYANVPVQINQVGSVLTLFFTSTPVRDYDTAKTSDTARFGEFFRDMREAGVFLPPSQYEAMFVSLAHSDDDLARVIAAAKASLTGLGAH